MASNSELMQLTTAEVQAMSKKETSLLLVSIIQLCGDMSKRYETSDGINKHVLCRIYKELDKLDGVIEIKSGIDSLGDNLLSLNKRIQELESAKNEMGNLDLSKKLEQLDKKLKDSLTEINMSQAYQQRFLEEMDARSRRNNLIIMGVPEGTVESALGTSDLEKALCAIQKTDIPVKVNQGNIRSLRRLGSDTSRARPILIELDCHETCKEILNNAKKLKYDIDCANVFIRRDVHPTLRFEANRLRIKERTEKANPKNCNADIQYDRKERVLRRNGIIIDRFRPSFL